MKDITTESDNSGKEKKFDAEAISYDNYLVSSNEIKF